MIKPYDPNSDLPPEPLPGSPLAQAQQTAKLLSKLLELLQKNSIRFASLKGESQGRASLMEQRLYGSIEITVAEAAPPNKKDDGIVMQIALKKPHPNNKEYYEKFNGLITDLHILHPGSTQILGERLDADTIVEFGLTHAESPKFYAEINALYLKASKMAATRCGSFNNNIA